METDTVRINFNVLTFWTRLDPASRLKYRAAYIVSFYLPVVPPDSALQCATFLLWFMKKATRDFLRAETNLNPTASPYLNNITYFFCRTGVYGVLFVDDNFGYWYNTLLGDSENHPDIHPRHASSNSVVAVYPTDDVSLRDADEIEACWNICRLVQYVTCLSGQY